MSKAASSSHRVYIGLCETLNHPQNSVLGFKAKEARRFIHPRLRTYHTAAVNPITNPSSCNRTTHAPYIFQKGVKSYSTDIFSQVIAKQKVNQLDSEQQQDLWKVGLSDILVTQEIFEATFKTDLPPYHEIRKLGQDYIATLEAKDTGLLDKWYDSVHDTFEKKTENITLLANLLFKAKQNKSLALDLYLSAAKFGDNNALYSYSTIKYLGAGGVEKGVEAAKKNLLSLACLGHPYAQLSLASIYIQEKTPDSQSDIIKLLSLSAKGGVSRALLKLGEYYKQNTNVPDNFKLAKSCLEKAVQGGFSEALFLLGDMESKGQTTLDGKPDYNSAFKFFEQAAGKGVVEAQYNMGVYYMNGLGTNPNIELTVEYWDMAAMQGFPMAAINLAKLYIEGFDNASAPLPSSSSFSPSSPLAKPSQKKIEKDPLKAKHYLVAAKMLGKGSYIERDADLLLKEHFPPGKSIPAADPKPKKNGGCTIM